MKKSIEDARRHLDEIKIKLNAGEDYYEMKKEAEPYLAIINLEGERIAKEFGRPYKKITFTSIMR